jgi:glycosyltransferase involved in cell wall biosynthesis
MKILVLTWEFPPRIIGGIARHVAELYPELVRQGHEIQLVTVQLGDALAYEQVEGIHVHRVDVGESHSFFEWVRYMNTTMGRYCADLIQSQAAIGEAPFDLIHAHDWLVGDAAIGLKHQFRLSLVSTIHATEHGRNSGIHSDIHRHVNHHEHLLTHESWRVIVCTNYMKREVSLALRAPIDKIDVVFNGIRAEKKQISPDVDLVSFRRRFARDDEKIIYYVGRMTHEKGIFRLLDAAPLVMEQYEKQGGRVKFVIIGGGDTSPYQYHARDLGIFDRLLFTGFMPDADLDIFQTIANCAVFPSLYEPFGIVALESFAARVPVVVSDTGGLPEIVRHGETGIVTKRDDPAAIAAGILQVLVQPELAQRLVDNAYRDLERFRWDHLAGQTAAIYQRVVDERKDVDW